MHIQMLNPLLVFYSNCSYFFLFVLYLQITLDIIIVNFFFWDERFHRECPILIFFPFIFVQSCNINKAKRAQNEVWSVQIQRSNPYGFRIYSEWLSKRHAVFRFTLYTCVFACVCVCTLYARFDRGIIIIKLNDTDTYHNVIYTHTTHTHTYRVTHYSVQMWW